MPDVIVHKIYGYMGHPVGTLVSTGDGTHFREIQLPMKATSFIGGNRLTPAALDRALASGRGEYTRVLPCTGWGPEVDEAFLLSASCCVMPDEIHSVGLRTNPKAIHSLNIPCFWNPMVNGSEEISDGVHPYTTSMDADEFRRVVASAAALFPRLGLAYYASLSAPLMRLLESPGFILEFSGPCGTGKTTAVSLAAAVWGRAIRTGLLQHDCNALVPWMLPLYQKQDIVKVRRDLPLCIGGRPVRNADRELSSISEVMAKDFCGMSTTVSPVIIAEGAPNPCEELYKNAPNGGLWIWGPILGDDPSKAQGPVTEVWEAISNGAGAVGVNWIQTLTKTSCDRHGAMASWHKSLLHNRTAAQAVSKGWAGHAAAFNVGTLITCINIIEALGMGLGEEVSQAVCLDLFAWLRLSAGSTEDRGEAGYRVVCTWVDANQKRFWTGDTSSSYPRSGWLGSMPPGGCVWIPWRSVEEILAMAGFNPAEIVREMARKGLIVTAGTQAGWVKRVRIAGTWTLCMGFKLVRDDSVIHP